MICPIGAASVEDGLPARQVHPAVGCGPGLCGGVRDVGEQDVRLTLAQEGGVEVGRPDQVPV
jgi:hypothetical protein